MITKFYAKRNPTQKELEHIANLVLQGKLVEAKFNLDMFEEILIAERKNGSLTFFKYKDKEQLDITKYVEFLKDSTIYDNYGNTYSVQELFFF